MLKYRMILKGYQVILRLIESKKWEVQQVECAFSKLTNYKTLGVSDVTWEIWRYCGKALNHTSLWFDENMSADLEYLTVDLFIYIFAFWAVYNGIHILK